MNNRVLLFVLFASCACLCAASAWQIPEKYAHAPHTRALPSTWRVQPVRERAQITLNFTVALKQRRVDELQQYLYRCSNPRDSLYGRYLSHAEVTELVAPPAQDIARVFVWLKSLSSSMPLGDTRLELVRSRDFIRVHSMPLQYAEELLRVTMQQYTHLPTGVILYRTPDDYLLPDDIVPLVDFVSSMHRLPPLRGHVQPVTVPVSAAKAPDADSTRYHIARIYPGDSEYEVVFAPLPNGAPCTSAPCFGEVQLTEQFQNWKRPVVTTINEENDAEDNLDFSPTSAYCQPCSSFGSLRPTCANDAQRNSWSSSTIYCVLNRPAVNYIGVNVSLSDSPKYPKQMFPGEFVSPAVLRERYRIDSSLRGLSADNSQSVAEFLGQYTSMEDMNRFMEIFDVVRTDIELVGFNNQSLPGGEATLDIEYIVGVAPNITTTFWSLGDQLNDGQEPFLTWIVDVLNAKNPPLVHSVSYGDDEYTLSVSYMQRCDVEFMKAGTMGLTILLASGDNGVSASTPGVGCNGQFYPSFPSSSPHVTTVGATQFSTQTTPSCDLTTGTGLRTRCTAVGEISSSTSTGSRISSGGGFSDIFPRPFFQDAEVEAYIEHSMKGIPSSWYNATGRAYPDVAACGRNYVTVLAGGISPVDGTSAATPTFAGVVSLMNDARLLKGLPPLGFINPWLYQLGRDDPTSFWDITQGNNACPESLESGAQCCAYGLSASVGFDLVTGWGTPKFHQMREQALRV